MPVGLCIHHALTREAMSIHDERIASLYQLGGQPYLSGPG